MMSESEELLDVRLKYYAALFNFWSVDGDNFFVVQRLMEMAREAIDQDLNENVKFAYLWFCLELVELKVIDEWFYRAFVKILAPERYEYLFGGILYESDFKDL